LSYAVKEAIFLHQLLTELEGVNRKSPVLIHEDSQSALAISKNLVYYSKTKHIDITATDDMVIRCDSLFLLVVVVFILDELALLNLWNKAKATSTFQHKDSNIGSNTAINTGFEKNMLLPIIYMLYLSINKDIL